MVAHESLEVQLLDGIAGITHAHVFASTDTTGAGGDWVLEAASTGATAGTLSDADVPLDRTALTSYTAELSTNEADGDPMIESAANGYKFTVHFYDCKDHADCTSIQFRTSGPPVSAT